MSQHTAEPWRYIVSGHDAGWIYVKGERLKATAHDIARIVTCINYCAGIETEGLVEGGKFATLVDVLRLNKVLREERDELTDALVSLKKKLFVDDPNGLYDEVCNALAKVTP